MDGEGGVFDKQSMDVSKEVSVNALLTNNVASPVLYHTTPLQSVNHGFGRKQAS